MKTLILIFLFFNALAVRGQLIPHRDTSSNLPPSREVAKYIKQLSKIVKNNSIYSDSLNWEVINDELSHLSKGLKTTEDAKVLALYIKEKLHEVGDNHSTFYDKTRASNYSVESIDGRQPFSKLLKNNIGYIYIPGFASTSDTTSVNFANKIQSLIKELDTQNEIEGWIVDLRENDGGNMFPMIAGLGPLTGEGTLCHYIDNNISYKLYYTNGATGVGKGESMLKVKKPYLLRNQNVPIAVLVSSMTASSGEMTAISFIGKPKVKLIGQPTGGYTTLNRTYKLFDGSEFNLAIGCVSDRNNNKYLGKIQPDIVVDEKEDIINVAQDWINKNK